ncbi:MAG: hypothetical protein KC425_17125, partial [Anaerolineales bacterium]|nr:hypothetical protein [Anaerolineales bacterium]
MEITPASWKQKAAPQYKKLGALAARLRRRAAPAGFVAYGALTTFTLWPLVEAATLAAQAGQPLPVSVLTALGAIAGGLGSNLLAGQIQAWYQAAAQGEPPTQEAVARWLMRHAPTQAALREEIDRVLAERRAVETAQTAVSPADWPLLARQLAAELHRLGNLSRYQARLSGSGILVQGEGNVVVAGGSAYVGGSVGGDLVIGVPDPTQAQPAALQAAYLARLLAERNQLWLGGIDPRAAAEESERLELSAVYTALLTETAEQDPAGRLDRAMADPA